MPTPALTVLEEDKHWWFMSRTRAILKYLDAEVGPAQPGQERMVLDIGGGAGNMAHHLAHYGRVMGLTSAPGHCLWPKCGATSFQGSGDALPFPDNSFDLITMLDTIEHIPNELAS